MLRSLSDSLSDKLHSSGNSVNKQPGYSSSSTSNRGNKLQLHPMQSSTGSQEDVRKNVAEDLAKLLLPVARKKTLMISSSSYCNKNRRRRSNHVVHMRKLSVGGKGKTQSPLRTITEGGGNNMNDDQHDDVGGNNMNDDDQHDDVGGNNMNDDQHDDVDEKEVVPVTFNEKKQRPPSVILDEWEDVIDDDDDIRDPPQTYDRVRELIYGVAIRSRKGSMASASTAGSRGSQDRFKFSRAGSANSASSTTSAFTDKSLRHSRGSKVLAFRSTSARTSLSTSLSASSSPERLPFSHRLKHSGSQLYKQRFDPRSHVSQDMDKILITPSLARARSLGCLNKRPATSKRIKVNQIAHGKKRRGRVQELAEHAVQTAEENSTVSLMGHKDTFNQQIKKVEDYLKANGSAHMSVTTLDATSHYILYGTLRDAAVDEEEPTEEPTDAQLSRSVSNTSSDTASRGDASIEASVETSGDSIFFKSSSEIPHHQFDVAQWSDGVTCPRSLSERNKDRPRSQSDPNRKKMSYTTPTNHEGASNDKKDDLGGAQDFQEESPQKLPKTTRLMQVPIRRGRNRSCSAPEPYDPSGTDKKISTRIPPTAEDDNVQTALTTRQLLSMPTIRQLYNTLVRKHGTLTAVSLRKELVESAPMPFNHYESLCFTASIKDEDSINARDFFGLCRKGFHGLCSLPNAFKSTGVGSSLSKKMDESLLQDENEFCTSNSSTDTTVNSNRSISDEETQDLGCPDFQSGSSESGSYSSGQSFGSDSLGCNSSQETLPEASLISSQTSEAMLSDTENSTMLEWIITAPDSEDLSCRKTSDDAVVTPRRNRKRAFTIPAKEAPQAIQDAVVKALQKERPPTWARLLSHYAEEGEELSKQEYELVHIPDDNNDTDDEALGYRSSMDESNHGSCLSILSRLSMSTERKSWSPSLGDILDVPMIQVSKPPQPQNKRRSRASLSTLQVHPPYYNRSLPENDLMECQ